MKQLSLSLLLKQNSQNLAGAILPLAIVRLTNMDMEKVVVNKRLLLVPEGSPVLIGEITFEIVGPPGSFSLKSFSVNAGKAGPEFFINLNPGEFVEKSYDLNNYFRYEIPGKYTIRAAYHNEVDHNNIKDEIWKGELLSNEEYFDIE